MIEPRDFVAKPLEVGSFGAGTQSFAMLLLVKQGKLSPPDLFIHADTGSEMPETLALIKVARQICEELGIPFVVVRSHRGALHEDYMSKGNIPIMGLRSCTANFKILPQRRFVRTIVGNGRGKILANFWLGITTDEERRRTDESDVKWAGLKYPLLDDHPISRDEAIQINLDEGLNIPKSGCWCCPYSGSKHWFDLRKNHPDLFALAIEMEEKKFRVKGGKLGLFRESKLSELDSLPIQEDSACMDSAGGCFI